MSSQQRKFFQTISPVDGSVYLEQAYSNDAEITTVIDRATVAKKQWQSLDLNERIKHCQAFLDALKVNKDDIARQLTWQMGRPLTQALGEINGVIERSQYMMSIAEQALADIILTREGNSGAFIRRYPVGVVLVVAPWNYPYLTAINTIIPALLAGNSVILKHSTQTPLCAQQLASAFETAGLPEGVFQVIFTDHGSTARLVASPEIDYVAFTGSVAGGRAITQAASQRFINLGLELGGKDPAYVCADVDFDHAVSQLVDGAFYNSGQSCCGIERIYVEKPLYGKFIDAYVAMVKQYRLGNPLDENINLGPVVRASAANFVREQVQQATSQGARALIDPSHFLQDGGDSAYLAPQVVVDTNHRMALMREENFGPVVGIMVVDGDDEALHWMNDSPYGLTASIWTSDKARALRMGERVDTGTWFMNRCDHLDPALAWTGTKNSGKGVSLSILGFESVTRVKSFNLYP